MQQALLSQVALHTHAESSIIILDVLSAEPSCKTVCFHLCLNKPKLGRVFCCSRDTKTQTEPVQTPLLCKNASGSNDRFAPL